MALRSPLFKRLFGPTHDDVVAAVDEALVQPGWRIEREPIIEGVRPDIVAHGASDGMTYVIEVKEGNLDANLGAVAQVEAFRNAAVEKYGGEAKGMLVVAGKIPEDLRAVAAGADVKLVEMESADVESARASLQGAGFLKPSSAA